MPTWTRDVPKTWEGPAGWRTDVSLRKLHEREYDMAEFHLEDGPLVKISMDELRRALADANVRRNLMIPFNLDPEQRTVNGVSVWMQVHRKK